MTTTIELRTRKIGNSMGVIFPKGFIEEEGIKMNEKIALTVTRTADFSKFFGMIKTKKSAQEIKDELRKGWD